MKCIFALLYIVCSTFPCNADDYDDNIEKWNPLSFPSTKLHAWLTFDANTWAQLLPHLDQTDVNKLCLVVQECLHDALGFTIESASNASVAATGTATATATTTATTPSTTAAFTIDLDTDTDTYANAPTKPPSKRDKNNHNNNDDNIRSKSDDSSSSRRRRRTLQTGADESSENSYDALLKGAISFKNIEKLVLSDDLSMKYTLGVLFNDLSLYDDFKMIGVDALNPWHAVLHDVFGQCLYLALQTQSAALHIMLISEGVYEAEYEYVHNAKQLKMDNKNNSTTTLNVDLNFDAAAALSDYKVMVTLNESCVDERGADVHVAAILDDIAAWYGSCLCLSDGEVHAKYKTFKVTESEAVYFFSIIDSKSCLIDIDMEYLEQQCVDRVEYEPVYELDAADSVAAAVEVECAALNVEEWNLDFFDGTPGDHTYHALSSQHEDRGVDLYILDTGILSTHEIFAHNENANLVYIHTMRVAGSTPMTTEPFIPSHYHGTFVAGIAGGDHYGISRNRTIYDYEVCEGASCTYSKVLAGIEAAKINMIATGRRGVINLSFGGPIASTNDIARQKWDFICEGIIAAGGIPVCSAGNTQMDGCDYVPGQSPYCISVGAFDEYGQLYSKTNFGECVNVFAPGVSIKSAGTTSTTQYITRSGTSAAAPHITGLISNLLWIHPTLTFEHIVYILKHNQMFLPSCPSNYTMGTQCPYIDLPCYSFQSAIDDALLNVASVQTSTKTPTMRPTPSPTTSTIIGTPTASNGDTDNILQATPSKEPTSTPTPTDIPTPAPTPQPSISPSSSPTSSPIPAPSKSPTVLPTKTPTDAPTSSPNTTHELLNLAGFNNGFNPGVDSEEIYNTSFGLNRLPIDAISIAHNDAYCVSFAVNAYLTLIVFLHFSLHDLLCAVS